MPTQPSPSISLADFLRSVYVPARLEISPKSVEQLASTIRRFERWAGRTIALAELTEDLVRRFLAAYMAGHSPWTVNAKRQQILGLWKCAWEEELLPSPPRACKIRRARAPVPIPEAWTAAEVGRILESAKASTGTIAGLSAPDWWRSLLLVCYDSGERRSAVFATGSSDLSLPGSWIVFRRTKTGQPRWCALHRDTIAALGRIYSPARELIWPWPWSRNTLEDRFHAILRRAGVAHGKARGGLFHKLRRTTGSLVEGAGGDGARMIGDTRAVFERFYLDPRLSGGSQLSLLPRPTF